MREHPRLARWFLPTLLIVALAVVSLALSLTAPTSAAPDNQDTPMPESVTLAGTIQSVLGCDGDWQPECEATFMTYDEDDDLWQAEFELEPGEYEYKVALNGSWDENYGAGAEAGGENILLTVEEAGPVQFFYDHDTHWVTDNVNSLILNLAGSFQSEVGCPGDWAPDCLRTWLQDPDGDGIYTFTTNMIPEGDWEVKVAANQSWDLSYGVDGDSTEGSPNIPFTVPAEYTEMTFAFDSASNLLDITAGEVVEPEPEETEMAEEDMAEDGEDTEETDEEGEGDEAAEEDESLTLAMMGQPGAVGLPGTFQEQLGCANNWAPECEETHLTFDEEDMLWQGSFDLAAGEYEYKVAIDNSWTENYGGSADQDGPNIPLVLEEDQTVNFFYSHETNWVADDVNDLIVNLAGDFQQEIGCPGDWQPDCLRTWLQDPDGDGIFVYGTDQIPPGDWQVKVPVNQSWDLSYGVDGDDSAGSPNIPFNVPEDGAYMEFQFDSQTNLLDISADGEAPAASLGAIGRPTAYWVTVDTIAFDAPDSAVTYRLYYAPEGGLAFEDNEIVGGESFELTLGTAFIDPVLEKFPFVEDWKTLHLPAERLEEVPELLKGQLVVLATDADGNPVSFAGLQISGVLDNLYTYDGILGVTWDGDTPTIAVWAPTARNVSLHVFDDADPDTESTVYEMTRNDENGVWSVTGEPDWEYKYYLFEVEVYVPETGAIENNMVTDPYSFSLAMNSSRSQIVDLSDPELMPDGWQELEKPEFGAPEDIVLYELHVRDFSANDETVPEEYRGKFMAFTETASDGMQHLIALAEAGLTHIHLLPSFDIATINEDPAVRIEPDVAELATFDATSERQQEIIDAVRDQDAFNWGYDPYHYTVPEGSYSTDPNGTARIIEFRSMVMSLNQNDLNVVMDVVYNHTNSAGQAERAVLDRIVPGYYHRYDLATGAVATSTCCPNTATEYNMMRKLMVDSVVVWVRDYKVDGFRFDLMGHHMVEDMLDVQEAVADLTVEEDGVDGSRVYIYGEGWNFGEVADNARGVNATQLNIGGTGIGAFNDRLRDAVRGGNPFGDWQQQGFINGLFYDPNGITEGDEAEQRAELLHFADQIRVGLAGNLEAYTFEGAEGEIVAGTEVDYNGSPAGYALDPQENIVYVSAHDNETLFDIIQYKAPDDATSAERTRMQNMGISFTIMSQGVPFLHAGVDMLRSKSLDRNSYNSGDWFNRLDYTYQTNYWAVGLPPEGDNAGNYGIMRSLFENPNIPPTPDDIMSAVMHTREMLQIRKSSPLFRLQTAEQIINRVNFHNTGPNQLPGVIVMSVNDQGELEDLDPNHELVVVVFNATDESIDFADEGLIGLELTLHSVQAESHDSVVQDSSFDAGSGTFSVPARTTAVFVLTE